MYLLPRDLPTTNIFPTYIRSPLIMKNDNVDIGIDILTEQYLKMIAQHVENDNFETAAAIFSEFVVDGVDPEIAPKFEWLYSDYGVGE